MSCQPCCGKEQTFAQGTSTDSGAGEWLYASPMVSLIGVAVGLFVVVRYRWMAAYAARQGRIKFEPNHPPVWLQVMALVIGSAVAIGSAVEVLRSIS